MKLKDLDHPVLFLFFITLGVLGIMSIMGYFMQKLDWTGPLGFFKQGVMPHNTHQTNQFG